jgi:hypothetical protein
MWRWVPRKIAISEVYSALRKVTRTRKDQRAAHKSTTTRFMPEASKTSVTERETSSLTYRGRVTIYRPRAMHLSNQRRAVGQAIKLAHFWKFRGLG